MRPQRRRSAGQQQQDKPPSSAAAAADSAAIDDNANAATSDFHIYTGRRSRRPGAGSSASSSGKAAARRANRQQREEEARLLLRRTLDELLERARYETYVDPYRGIYADVGRGGCGFAHPPASSDGTSGAAGRGDEELARRLRAAELAGRTNPWGGCRGVPLGRNFLLEEDRAEGDAAAGEGDADGGAATGVGWVPRCSCPSVTSWYDDEVTKRRAKLEKERAASAKKRGRGKGKDKDKTEATPAAAAGEAALAAVELAENVAAGTGAKIADAAGVVTVRRNPAPAFRCPCDYNPLCLASLGGAVDDLWGRAIAARRFGARGGSGGGDRGSNRGRRDGDVLGSSGSRIFSSCDDGGLLGNIARANKDAEMPAAAKPDEGGVLGNSVCGEMGGKDAGSEGEIKAVNYGEEDTLGDLPIQVRRSVTVDVEAIRSYVDKFVVTCLASGRRGSGRGRGYSAHLDEDAGTLTVDGCMDLIRLWHRSLVFPPLLLGSSNDGGKTMVLSAPPGMRNLGATCYLNSQFQCLAQNPAFLRGVFSWRDTTTSLSSAAFSASSSGAEVGSGNGNGGAGGGGGNRMARILSTMQLVLARMIHGPTAVVCTDDFATALGLENNEMQDPNEFARLLFDRMHESFQLSSQSGGSVGGTDGDGRGQNSLAELLPSIFRGVCTYETTCRHCQKSSCRSENFTDLTLPLVPPPSGPATGLSSASSSKRRGSGGRATNGSIEDRAAAAETVTLDPRDTTLQACLDSYLHPELLEGDNKYHCGSCDAKRDACRSVSFGHLPPVLNVQVARYVFDRKTLMKKKLTDRVLLPRVLRVPKRRDGGGRRGSGIPTTRDVRGGKGSKLKCKSRKTGLHDADGGGGSSDSDSDDVLEYVLCAVQNHRGTSAYGGHYVAEAMDWTTGTWYEHNDEEVSLLEGGPNCSYDPADLVVVADSDAIGPISTNDGGGGDARTQHHGRGSRMKKGQGASGSSEEAPRAAKAVRCKTPPPLRGSADAYSMFFVERIFLAENAALQMRHDAREVHDASDRDVGIMDESDVVARVTKERVESYQMMTEVRMQKRLLDERLGRRRVDIARRMLPLSMDGAVFAPAPRSADPHDVSQHYGISGPPGDSENSPVWVDGDPLRRFLSCTDGLDDQLRQSGRRFGVGQALLRHRRLLCKHGKGLHPSVARRGKLLPRAMYDAYAELLVREWRELRGDDESEELPVVNDCVITPGSNLRCDECALAYQAEIERKIEILMLLAEVHDALEGNASDLDPHTAYVVGSGDGDGNVYGVSRSFASAFRKYAGRKIREASSPAPSAVAKRGQNKQQDGTNANSAAATSSELPYVVLHEGLDVLDLGEIPYGSSSDMPVALRSAETEEETGAEGEDEPCDGDEVLDPQINSKITCPHGRSTALNNRRVVRFVSHAVWKKLKGLFPRAICHRRKPWSDGDERFLPDGNCRQCQIDKDEKVEIVQKLSSWARQSSSDDYQVVTADGHVFHPRLRHLLEWQDTHPTALEPRLITESSRCFLVHRLDVDAWRSAVEVARALVPLSAKKSSKGRPTGEEVRRKLLDLLFDCGDGALRTDGESSGSAPSSSSLLPPPRPWRMRSLLCSRHGLAAVSLDSVWRFRTTAEEAEVKEDGLAYLLTEAEYLGFAGSLLELESVLFLGSNSVLEDVGGAAASGGDAAVDPSPTKGVRPLPCNLPFEKLHPVVVVTGSPSAQPRDATGAENRFHGDEFVASMAGFHTAACSDWKVVVRPPICQDDLCVAEFMAKSLRACAAPTKESSKSSRSGEVKNSAERSTDRGSGKRKKRTSDSDLLVGSQKDDGKLTIKVYELEPHIDITTALSLLVPTKKDTHTDPDGLNAVRRSSRKRKTRSDGTKGLTTHDIQMSPEDNVAKLRLLLMQECNKTPVHQELSLILLNTRNGGINSTNTQNAVDVDGDSAAAQISSVAEPLMVNISWEWNERAILDVVQLSGGRAGRSNKENERPSTKPPELTVHLLLRYNDGLGGQSKKTRSSREERERNQQEEDDLVAMLSELANTTDPHLPEISITSNSASKDSRGKRKEHLRRRREERGFRGTFLQSTSSVSDGTKDANEQMESASPMRQDGRSEDRDDGVCQPEHPQDGFESVRNSEPAKEVGVYGSSSCVDEAGVVCVDVDDEQMSHECSCSSQDRAPSRHVDDDSGSAVQIDGESHFTGTGAGQVSSSLCVDSSTANQEVVEIKPTRGQSQSYSDSELSDSSLGSRSNSATLRGQQNVAEAQRQLSLDHQNIRSYWPKSVWDLSPSALSCTQPIYNDNADKEYPLKSTDGKLLSSEFEVLPRRELKEFVGAAKERYMHSTSGRDKNNTEIQHKSPTPSDLSQLLPDYIPEDHARHLYRNFVDSPDSVGGPSQDRSNPPARVYVSRREMDIMLYFCSIDKSCKECHDLMPYRKLTGLRRLFTDVKRLNYHGCKSPYMVHVKGCVEVLLQVEGMHNSVYNQSKPVPTTCVATQESLNPVSAGCTAYQELLDPLSDLDDNSDNDGNNHPIDECSNVSKRGSREKCHLPLHPKHPGAELCESINDNDVTMLSESGDENFNMKPQSIDSSSVGNQSEESNDDVLIAELTDKVLAATKEIDIIKPDPSARTCHNAVLSAMKTFGKSDFQGIIDSAIAQITQGRVG